jgi:hypothetical protein
MDIQALKLDLVERIIQIDQPSILLKINKILQNNSDDNWWEKLPPEIQESIKEGLNDVKNGNVFSHEQVIKEAKQKYGF